MKTVRLGDIFQVSSSKRVLKSQWQSHGVPFYRGREITRLSLSGHVKNDLYISNSLYSDLKNKFGVPQSGDIMVTAIGTIGNTYVVKSGDKFYFKDASVLWLKNQGGAVSEFVNYWFKSPLFRCQLEQGNGTTVDTLTIKKLQSITIALPSLDEQRQIVKKLDATLEKVNQVIALTKSNYQNSITLFDLYRDELFASVDKGYLRKLGEVCEKVEYGSSAKSKQEGKVPVVRMGNIQQGKIDWSNLVYSVDDAEIERYRLNYNDVLFNRTNSPELVGKAAIYKGEAEALFAGYLIRIHRKTSLLDADYLNNFLNSTRAKNYGTSVMSKSINQANINGTKLKSYPIPIPPLKDQELIAKKLDHIKLISDDLQKAYFRKLSDLAKLRDSLLNKALE